MEVGEDMRYPLTAEQSRAMAAYTDGRSIRLEAGAGTGKTSTLQQLAASVPSRRVTYVAYNRAAASDAKARFGRNSQCVTAHAYALRNLRSSGDPAAEAIIGRLSAHRTSNTQLANHLGIRQALRDGERALQPNTIARLAKETLTRWCYSSDETITHHHVPRVEGSSDALHQQLIDMAVPLAKGLWADATNRDGRLRTEHDHYLKLFALRGSRWDTDVVMLDEAQDSNPVVVGMIRRQQAHGKQLIVVGDRSQSIYGWRGAVDAMSAFDLDETVMLSKSWRFGPAIADEANKWLGYLGAELHLTGTDQMASQVIDGWQGTPDAYLARTNAAAVTELMAAQLAGKRACLVGGGRDIRGFAEAAMQLKQTGRTSHPDLCAFTSWGQVQDYVDHDGGGDLATMVKLVDDFGAEQVMEAVDASAPEDSAEVVMSTAHRSKGREWDRVKVADDFTVDEEEPPSPADAMLAYVTVTRARKVLDRGTLAGIDKLIATSGSPAGGGFPPLLAPGPCPAEQPVSTTAPAPAPDDPFADMLPLFDLPAVDPVTVTIPADLVAQLEPWTARTGMDTATFAVEALRRIATQQAQ